MTAGATETVFLDTDIFVLDLRYPADRHFRYNRRLLDALQGGGVAGVTSIYNILELCGILSFNLAPEELAGLYAGLSDRYSVRVLFPPGGDESICFSVTSVFSQIAKKMSLGDALIADLIESDEESRFALFLSWNAKHFAGKLAVEAMTPQQFLAR